MKPMSLYMDLGPVFDTQQVLEAFYFALIVSYNIARAILVYIFISYTLLEQRFTNNIFSKFSNRSNIMQPIKMILSTKSLFGGIIGFIVMM